MSNVFSAVVRLTADSELRSTPNGNQVLGFGIANNQGFGERQTVLFLRCQLWGKRGESLHQYLKKGTQCFITGELSQSEYQDKNTGETKRSLELNVQNVELVGSKGDNSQAPQQQAQSAQAPSHAGYDAVDDLDSKIPF